MKKITIFIFLAIFLLIFFIHSKQVVAAELDCIATGVSGMILNEKGESVGAVRFGLTGGGPNASHMDSKDGSFNFFGGTYQSISEKGELTLYYTFSNDSPYESGEVILNQCTDNKIYLELGGTYTCQISANNSAEHGQRLGYTVSGNILTSQEFLNNQIDLGMVVYDEKGKFIECRTLSPSGGGFITTPLSGNSIVLRVAKTKMQTTLTEACGEILDKICSKTISLTKTSPPSCTASISKDSPYDKVTVNIKNLGESKAVFYIIGPKPNKETLITRTVGVGTTEISAGYQGWTAGNYSVEIREKGTEAGRGTLLTSCNFDYDGITPLDRLNKQDLQTTEYPDLVPTINKIVNYSMGIGGIIAFLLIVFGGFQIIVSGGNPERVKAGKEMITSAIAGLLLIIFSVFILRVIGYDILAIPGFGK